MAKTIDQLTALSAVPDDSADFLAISDGGVTKKITVGNLKGDCIRAKQNNALDSSTGTKIGTNANQLLGFWNATPVDQPALTADLLDSLQEVGLIAGGSGDTPLNLTGGALTCGAVTCGSITGTTAQLTDVDVEELTIADGENIVIGSTTGTEIGDASSKIGFYGATPVVQHSTTGEAAGMTLNSGDDIHETSTFTGNVGSKAYTIGDIVKALKNVGILAAS